MAINPKLLNQGERVVISTRTHPKVLAGPVIVLLVVVFATAFLGGKIHSGVDNPGGEKALWAVLLLAAAVALLVWCVKPVLSWLSTTYTFTDRRFIQRSGIVSKEGRTIPLNRISGVDFEMGVIDRIFGCGTLVVSDASEHGRVPVSDIPRVEEVQRIVAEELHQLSQRDRHHDDGT